MSRPRAVRERPLQLAWSPAMQYQDFMEKWAELVKSFPSLEAKPDAHENKAMAELIRRYTEQNLEVLNDIVSCNMDYLRKLNKVKSPEEISLLNSQLVTELGTKMMFNSQRFTTMLTQDLANWSVTPKKS